MAEPTLALIASKLEGLEDTIIYKLLDRAQFARNLDAYKPGKSGFANAKETDSLFDMRLLYHEQMDAKFGRFKVPEERPFLKHLPEAKRNPDLANDNFLKIPDYDAINITEKIKSNYFSFLDRLCVEGDDKQYGSSVEHDIYALQALARRIHFGSLYVAECKFRENSDKYTKLIRLGDTDYIMKLLTRQEVEASILKRIKTKVDIIQGHINEVVRRRINPEIILEFYKNSIIPLTKDGEILYLMNRK